MPFGKHVEIAIEIGCAPDRGRATRRGPTRTDRLPPNSRAAQSATICCARISSGAVAESPGGPARRERMARTKAAHSINSSRVVAKKRPLGLRADPMPGAADALQRHRDGAWRADLADQVDRADIDSQFERSGGHHGAQFAALQARLGVQA